MDEEDFNNVYLIHCDMCDKEYKIEVIDTGDTNESRPDSCPFCKHDLDEMALIDD